MEIRQKETKKTIRWNGERETLFDESQFVISRCGDSPSLTVSSAVRIAYMNKRIKRVFCLFFYRGSASLNSQHWGTYVRREKNVGVPCAVQMHSKGYPTCTTESKSTEDAGRYMIYDVRMAILFFGCIVRRIMLHHWSEEYTAKHAYSKHHAS